MNGHLQVNSILRWEIVKADMMNMPSTLRTGETPLHFYLDTHTCTKCNLCADVCIVNALELKADYNYEKVDLVIKYF